MRKGARPRAPSFCIARGRSGRAQLFLQSSDKLQQLIDMLGAACPARHEAQQDAVATRGIHSGCDLGTACLDDADGVVGVKPEELLVAVGAHVRLEPCVLKAVGVQYTAAFTRGKDGPLPYFAHAASANECACMLAHGLERSRWAAPKPACSLARRSW